MNFKMKYLFNYYSLIVLILACLFSCGNPSDTKEIIVDQQEIKFHKYGDSKFVFPEFTGEAKMEVSHWGAFEDFENEVKTINGNTVEALKIKTNQLVFHIDSLIKKIPDTLNTRAISSRVIVVKTRTLLLEQELNKSRIDSLKIQNYLREVNISVKNLIVQINEKFQKDAIDLQKSENEKQELEKQEKYLDSIYQLELQDQKN